MVETNYTVLNDKNKLTLANIYLIAYPAHILDLRR
jgi:hypothetical protein